MTVDLNAVNNASDSLFILRREMNAWRPAYNGESPSDMQKRVERFYDGLTPLERKQLKHERRIMGMSSPRYPDGRKI